MPPSDLTTSLDGLPSIVIRRTSAALLRAARDSDHERFLSVAESAAFNVQVASLYLIASLTARLFDDEEFAVVLGSIENPMGDTT